MSDKIILVRQFELIKDLHKDNEKLNQEIKDLRHLVEMNHHEIHELSELEYEVRIEKQKLKKKLELIVKEFEHGLPTSMKECANICSKIYDLLENKK